MSQIAYLSNDKRFTSFKYAGHNIRFRTSERLEYYTEVKEWGQGYIVVMAKYEGGEPGDKVTFFAVAVDSEGNIGKPFKQEYTLKTFEYNDLQLTLTLMDYKVDSTIITPSCEGAVSYRYIYCPVDDNKWRRR